MKVRTHQRVGRRGQQLLAVLLVSGALSSMAASASADTGPTVESQRPSRDGGQSIDARDNATALNYWTEERMRNASTPQMLTHGASRTTGEPTDRGTAVEVPPASPDPAAQKAVTADRSRQQAAPVTGTAGTAATSAVTSEGYWQGSNTANPNSQIGKLFYQQWSPSLAKWVDYACSGTVVNSENKSVVWTAGHCVYQTYSNVWNRNYTFCPGYRNAICALGRWTPSMQGTTAQWQNAKCLADLRCYPDEFAYDFGILKMNAINGVRIANSVGSHGLSFSGPTYQTRYLFGYPGNQSNGQYLYFCYGSNTYVAPNMRMTPCGAGAGASGGPWLSQINSSWLGAVHSVNSNGSGEMNGPYQGSVALSLFNSQRY